MPFLAAGDLTPYYGREVDGGECVAFVRRVTAAPHTSLWRPGVRVRGGGVGRGTAISTFRQGRYSNSYDGTAHCAILLAEHADGLLVADQWKGQPVAHRVLQFRGGRGKAVNDGDAFYVIEVEPLIPDD
jgi:hypothetical protein